MFGFSTRAQTEKEENSVRGSERARVVLVMNMQFSYVKYVQIASRYSSRPFIIVASSYSPSWLAVASANS